MKKTHLIISAIILVIVAGVLYYGLSPLLKTKAVDDPLPETVSESQSNIDPSIASGVEKLSLEEQAAMEAQMAAKNAEGPLVVEENAPIMETSGANAKAEVKGTVGHPASGMARVIQTASGPVVRFENFKTINGPRLHIYLSKDLEGSEFIDLGPIKGTEGNINYDVPPGTDLSEYRYVLHWCVPFSVLFNYADVGMTL